MVGNGNLNWQVVFDHTERKWIHSWGIDPLFPVSRTLEATALIERGIRGRLAQQCDHHDRRHDQLS